MEDETTKCPYNTIYTPLNNKKPNGDILCCVHGNCCIYGKDVKTDENQYVNLASPKTGEMGAELKEKLAKLAEEEAGPRKPELMSLNSLMAINEEKKTRKETESDKEKRKKRGGGEHVLVDDSQSYVMLGPSSEEPPTAQPSAPVPVSEMSMIEEKHINGEAASAYIGVRTLIGAENQLTSRGEFALYHLFNPNALLDSLAEKLPLMLVYRTTTKKNRHYSIRFSAEKQYFVDCGYPNVRKHFSLNQLVMFYKFSATCEINPDDASADSFSWWLE